MSVPYRLQEAVGLLPYLRHRRVLAVPTTWAPFTVYFVGSHSSPSIDAYITDANGNPERVADGLFARWLAIAGNENKTYDDFAAAMVGDAAAGKFAATFGDGAALSYTLTHNLNTLDVVVMVREVATNRQVHADITAATVNTVSISGFVAAPAVNALRATIIG